MKLQPEPRHRQLHLSLLNQPPTHLPDGQEEELAVALMELLLQAANSETLIAAELSGGQDESETHE
ncbi:MAG: hypothetical protein ACLPPV_22480 [Candidatus Korobacteraceae bacterium]|jgi:hypothetical protein